MAGDVQPVELARALDVSEHPRAGGWSLRSALTRYAQREPERVRALLDAVRRLEAALHPRLRDVADRGPAYWAAVPGEGGPAAGDGAEGGLDATTLGLLRCAVELDHLGDVLAGWAGDPITLPGPGPDAEVDATTAEVAGRLDELGVAREERTGPPPRRARR